MGYLVALTIFVLWPLSAVLGQRIAKERGRDPDLWLFLCGLFGPLALGLLRFVLAPGSGKIARRRPVDRLVAIVSVLFLVGLVCFSLFYSCFTWR